MGLELQRTGNRGFTVGLDRKVADVQVGTEGLLRADNCRVRRDRIEKSPDFEKYTTTALSGAVKVIWGDKLGSDYRIIIAAGTKVVSASGGAYTDIITGLTSGALVDIAWQQDRLFVGSNTDTIKKINSSLVASTHGIVAPAAIITNVTERNVGTGILSAGTYQFYVTFYDSTNIVESNPYSIANSLNIAAGPSDIRLNTFPTTSDTNVDKYRIYMTETNGAEWFRIDEVSYATYSNPANNYDITTTLPTYGVTLEYDNNNPSNYYLVESCFDSLFVVYNSTKTYVNFSKQFRPEQFPAPFRLGINEEIKCLAKFYDYLVIGTDKAIWVLDDHPLNGGVPRRAQGYVGMINNTAYAILDNQFVFMGTDKRIYAMDPTMFSKTDIRPTYISERIEPLLNDISDSALTKVCAIYESYKDRKDLIFAVPVGSATANDYWYVMDATTGAWTNDFKLTSAFGTVRASDNSLKNYFGDESGYLYINNSGTGYGASWSGTADSSTSTTLTDVGVVTISSTATSGGASTLTDTTQNMTVNFYTAYQIYIVSGTGAGQYRTIASNTATVFTVSVAWTTQPDNTSVYYVGGFLQNSLNNLYIDIISGTGVGQRRIISSHTPAIVTVSSAWDTNPDTTSIYVIGGIDFNVHTGWDTHTEDEERTKRGWFIHMSAQAASNYDLTYGYAVDLNYDSSVDQTITISSGGYLYDAAVWGSAYWSAVNSVSVDIDFQHDDEYYQRMQHRFRNQYPNQDINVNYISVSYQDKNYMRGNIP